MESFVHAMFADQRAAAHAVDHLIDAGFAPAQISALLRTDGQVREVEVQHKTAVAGGAITGALVGATVGALALSGVGLLAVGPVFGALEAALAGGAFGTLAGALGGLGYWKEEIDFPAASFEAGAVLVGVSTNDERVDEARALLQSAGAAQASVSSKHEALRSAATHN